ncbi:MAG TPA: hypothetical protein PKC72_15955 [Chitinophagaceae bacterium]|nr:hypothetical protein [Chitinophagaceae bacterium]
MKVAVLTEQSLRELKYEILETIKGITDKEPEQPKKWLLKKELQEIIDISSGTLKMLRDNGTLKYWREGNTILYDWEWIEGVLEGRDVQE